MPERLRVVHCLNQFFGGVGGEEAADVAPQWQTGACGPGRLLESLAPDFAITGTVVFGDDYLARDAVRGAREVVELVRAHGVPDLLVAGPAFHAGRYGLACGAICRAAQDVLGVPALAAMYPENPGVDAYRRDVAIVRAERDVTGMREALERLAAAGRKLVRGEALDRQADAYLGKGLRANAFAARTGAERAVDMLLAKLRGSPFATEYPLPVFDRVPAAPALEDVASARIALVTSGGIVPTGNPDRIESANARRWACYEIGALERLSASDFQTVHGGYDPTHANADPNRVLPLDMARVLEREGRIGRLHERYCATVGNATEVAQARRFGREIAERLRAEGVQAVILTST